MKILFIRKWIIYLSLFGMTLGYTWEFIILFCILIIMGDLKDIFKQMYSKGLFLLSVFLVIESTIIFYFHYDIKKFFEQVLLISSFFLLYRVYVKKHLSNLGSFIKCYLNFSLFMAIYAIITYFFGITFGGRACIWAGEAGDLSLLLLPSIVFYLYKRKWSYEIVIIGAAFILASSAASFLALVVVFLIIFVVNNRKTLYKFLLGIIIVLYIFILFFKYIFDNGTEESGTLMKYQESIQAVTAIKDADYQDLELFNASTYAFMTNMKVAVEAPSRVIGTGLGTHKDSYEKLNPSRYSTYRLHGLNKEDAYSLSIRVFSEFGFIGFIILFLFIYKNYNQNNILNLMTLSYIINACITGGHYTDRGLILFFFLYYYTNKKNKGILYSNLFIK